MREAKIVSTARTPIGRAYKGAFNATPAPTLAAHAIREAVAPQRQWWRDFDRSPLWHVGRAHGRSCPDRGQKAQRKICGSHHVRWRRNGRRWSFRGSVMKTHGGRRRALGMRTH